MEEVGREVALGIVAITAVVDPELVGLAGGVGARPRFVRAVVDALPQVTARPVEVTVSPLGDRAGLLGAVALAAGVLDEDGRITSGPPPKGVSSSPGGAMET